MKIAQVYDLGANRPEVTTVYVTSKLPSKTYGISGLLGVVKGATLGQPFSVNGDITLALALLDTTRGT